MPSSPGRSALRRHVLVLSVLAPCLSAARTTPPAFADPWSDESLAAALAELQPLVEAEAGRTFTTPPKVVRMNGDEHLSLLRAEYTWIFGELMGDAPEAIRAANADGSARLLFVGALGKYGVLDKNLYLNAPAIEASTAQAGLPPEAVRDVLRLILAHELTHALQDQVVDLRATVEDLADMEQMSAASATWEGQATWVEGRVAARIGLDDLFWKLNGLQGWGRDGLIDVGSWHTWSTYGQGYRFQSHQHQRGGVDQVWRTLDEPPGSTAQIWRPEAYDPVVPTPPRDYAAVLRGVEQQLTKGDWLVANTRIGETLLRGDAVHDKAGLPALEEALAHLRWAHGLELEREDRTAEIRVLEFDDPSWARRWLELLRQQRTAVNAHAAAEIGAPIEVITEPFTDAPGDDAVLRIERIPMGGGRHLERHQAWVVRGDTAVVVTAERFRPGLRLGWTVEEVYRRLAATDGPN